MNPETGELKPIRDLLKEFHDEDGVREAGFVPVPKHLEAGAMSLLSWADRQKKRRNRKQNKTARTSRRQNRS